ncbi:MAG: AraC family transcriptional regulator [Cellvibrionales bacterium]|nr:AraC family transcriptional regulator [Cellvibrionales bacterium]
MRWLKKKRMHQAQRLLVTTELSVQEIAFRVGYLDANNFSTAFKQVIGSSPVQYKRQYQDQ